MCATVAGVFSPSKFPESVSLFPESVALPEPEPTGHSDVDLALGRLRELGERPTGAHPDLYDAVHQRLQEVLAQIDQQDSGRQRT